MDTITGISTPIGSGAISIVRLSGNEALSIALRFFKSKAIEKEGLSPSKMYLGEFSGAAFKEKCMLVYFAAPRSYTGEDIVELQLHGGVRLTNNVLKELLGAGARRATAGEFSRRAFLNGKMTLSEAEGVLGLINAESEAELAALYRMTEGALGRKLSPINQKLLDVIALLTAALDYPDEMADEILASEKMLADIRSELAAFYATAKTGRMIKNGINAAIIGRPNVGKSSLLNALLDEERAIVTDIPGTTRDTISESLVYGGVRINLLDTAGLRKSAEFVEELGIKRAIHAADVSDVIIYVIDVTEGETAEDTRLLSSFGAKRVIKVYNKSDIYTKSNFEAPKYADGIVISAARREGVEKLLDALTANVLEQRLYGDMLTEERHIDATRRALEHLDSATESFGVMPEDCVLVDLNSCYQALSEIDGGTATEEIIDNVFSRFCVGK